MLSIYRQIEADFDRHLARAQRLVRQPSVSATGEGVVDCAELVADMIRELRGVARVIPTAGHPVVLGRLWAGQPRTLLLYGMYDVQPAPEEDWSVPPFAGIVKEVPELGMCLVGRGATNSKGPLAGFLNAIEAFHRDNHCLPVNLLFMIEGEEELGSPNLPGFVRQRKELLQEADAVYFPAFREDRSGTAYIQLGTKGSLFMELRVRGAEWGGPCRRAIHGAYNALIGSPVWRAVHMLASLVDHNEHIRIPAFYDRIAEPNEDDEEALSELAKVQNLTPFLEECAAKRFKHAGDTQDLLRHLQFDPVLNLSGIRAGHVDAGTKSIVPSEVVIRCEFRLSPSTEPQIAEQSLRSYLAAQGFGDVEVDVLAANRGSKASVREPVAQALMSAYRDVGITPYVHPVNPGWAPLFLFSEVLGRPYAIGGLGHGERAHSSDELCTLDGLVRYEKCAAAFLHRFSIS